MTNPRDDDELTPAAKAEIQRAIQLVREDKQYKALTEVHGWTRPKDPADPPKPPADPPKPPADPPKPTDPPKPADPPAPPPKPTDPPNPEPPAKKSGLWWGDRVEDD